MKITNEHGISLPLAVWLLHDNYDYVSDPNYISATTLLKSTKQIILGRRVPSKDRSMDVSEFIAARFGNAVHDSVERAWTDNYSRVKALRQLGYPEKVTDKIVINPTETDFKTIPDLIPIWIETRSERTVNGFRVGGRLDMVADGRLFDTKTTSVYSYLKGRKDDDYTLQGSIYRWLNEDKITEDHVHIQFVFTDWQKAMAIQQKDKGYPQIKMLSYPVPLLSIEETERFITGKLNEIKKYRDAPEEQIPECTDKELWRGETEYKYYSDSLKAKDPTARSSKNFDNKAEAHAFMQEKGKGIVVEKPGEVKACLYCAAYDICKQKDRYFA